MSEELNNLIDDILKEKLKLHYENEELESQGKLIKELCKEIERLKEQLNDEIEDELKQSEIMLKQHNEIERLNNIIKEVREYLRQKSMIVHIEKINDFALEVYLKEEDYNKLLEILDKVNK